MQEGKEKTNKARIYPLIGAVIGAVIGFVFILLLENRKEFLSNENLLDLVIIGASVGASIGAAAGMFGKGEMFIDSAGSLIGSMVYGAAIGAVADLKFSQPVPRAIAGVIVALIAFVSCYK